VSGSAASEARRVAALEGLPNTLDHSRCGAFKVSPPPSDHDQPERLEPRLALLLGLDHAGGVVVEVLDSTVGLAHHTLLQPREVHPAHEAADLVVDRDLRDGRSRAR
jgi:hypothetical protein